MKKIMPWAIVGVFFVSILSSCASSNHRCDAYSYNDNQTQQNTIQTAPSTDLVKS